MTIFPVLKLPSFFTSLLKVFNIHKLSPKKETKEMEKQAANTVKDIRQEQK